MCDDSSKVLQADGDVDSVISHELLEIGLVDSD
jgi:hypothetical protein